MVGNNPEDEMEEAESRPNRSTRSNSFGSRSTVSERNQGEKEPSWSIVSVFDETTAGEVESLWNEGTARAQEKVVDKLLGTIRVGDVVNILDTISADDRYKPIVCKVLKKNLQKSPYLEVVFINNTGLVSDEPSWWISPKNPIQIPLLCLTKPEDILVLYGAVKVDRCKAIVVDWTQTSKDVIVIHCSSMGPEEDECTKDRNILSSVCMTYKIITHEYITSKGKIHEPNCVVSLLYPYKEKPDVLQELDGELEVENRENIPNPNGIPSPELPIENGYDVSTREKSNGHKSSRRRRINSGSSQETVDIRCVQQSHDDSWGSFPEINETPLNASPATSSLNQIDYEDFFVTGRFLPCVDRPKVAKFTRDRKYVYSTLKQLDLELKKSIKNDCSKGVLSAMCLKSQRFVFGSVTAICPPNQREYNAYHVRISDETMSDVRLRIHGNSTYREMGPKINIGDVMRVHRVTVQVEYDHGADGTGDGSHTLVLSTTPHHNYTLFSFDEESNSIVYNTCAKTLTLTDYDKRRAFNLLKHFCNKERNTGEPGSHSVNEAGVSQQCSRPEANESGNETDSDQQNTTLRSKSAEVHEFLELFEDELAEGEVFPANGENDLDAQQNNHERQSANLDGMSQQRQRSDQIEADVDVNSIALNGGPQSQLLSLVDSDDDESQQLENLEEAEASRTDPKTNSNTQSQRIETQTLNLDDLLDDLGCSEEGRSGAEADRRAMVEGLQSQALSLIDESQQVQKSEKLKNTNTQSQRIESQSINLDDLLDDLGRSQELQVDVKPFLSPSKRSDPPPDHVPRKSPRFHKSPPPSPV